MPRVIIDDTGSHLPVGLAEVLAVRGRAEVEIITPRLFLGEDLLGSFEMTHLFPRIMRAGVKITAQHFVEKIEDRRADIYNVWGGKGHGITEIDTIVLSMMRIPNDALFMEIRNHFGAVHRVGDVVAPRKLAAVIYEGEELGREL